MENREGRKVLISFKVSTLVLVVLSIIIISCVAAFIASSISNNVEATGVNNSDVKQVEDVKNEINQNTTSTTQTKRTIKPTSSTGIDE